MKIVNMMLLIVNCIFGNPKPNDKTEMNLDAERFNQQLENVKTMIASGTYNSKIAFFIDMKIKSGKNRFFVYDLENNTIIDEGLVANGSGSETAIRGELKFSNIPNSKCTSLGRYSIGKSYRGIFGKAYVLKGLDNTNNNATKRMIVLHSYSAVPEGEQDHYIALSQGCPMVSEAFFKRLEKIIDSSKSNIIMNVYY
ncbi:MAG: murein L,D-transpeptidase catalytic domain family protein [Flavobacterium nitrogenifigens]|uniref:murein L,D-transpeptidase catalytic domain-containing protein n=1 Tax=Flavobacterium nitrogenifigens TaxID=1617283 RepID=UPI002809434B|nr:murein L,D-transpeptidase catalytic domain family protein [Flavobacterium nitrogenifigens]MDQ8012567.1 murein L,D-transpeptidase catalytic domain family protein [Flavobacterium nitrogenifigens]